MAIRVFLPRNIFSAVPLSSRHVRCLSPIFSHRPVTCQLSRAHFCKFICPSPRVNEVHFPRLLGISIRGYQCLISDKVYSNAVTMASELKWHCEACTFINDAADTCSMCGTPNGSWEGFPLSKETKDWPCRACTFLNKSGDVACAVCFSENQGNTDSTLQSTFGAFKTESEFHVDDSNRGLKSPESTTSRMKADKAGADFANTGELHAISEDSGSEKQIDAQKFHINETPRNLPSEKLLSSASGSASFNQWLGSSRGLKRNFSVDIDSETVTGGSKHKHLMAPDSSNVNGDLNNGVGIIGGLTTIGTEELPKIPEDVSKADNKLLSSLHAERKARGEKAISADNPSKDIEGTSSAAGHEGLSSVTILTYNVWFREDLEVEKRMAAIGVIIEQHKPHVICLQEVTPNIYRLLHSSNWWRQYECSVSADEAPKRAYFTMQLSRISVKTWHREPFRNSVMGRELSILGLQPEAVCSLIVATTHLESPCPAPPTWDQMFSKERVVQAKMAFDSLKDMKNVVFCGDMNWDDKSDGAPPLPLGWKDVWEQRCPGEVGYTYDGKANEMVGGRLRKRLDRVFVHLRDFEVEQIQMVGTKAIPGLTYSKEKTVKRVPQTVTLPVFPSDHFGLLLKLRKV